jgi:autotransporter-associated beta strand protein
VFLGSNGLTGGKNDLSTIFSGVLQDGGPSTSQTGGSLTKIGKGTLTLSNANLYTGGTVVASGPKGGLAVTNTTGSGTGTGSVQVLGGRLSGTGKISGLVTVGSGQASTNTPLINAQTGTLTVNNTVTFNAYSAFKCHVNRDNAAAANLKAVGVIIGANVSFILVEGGTTALTPGTVFTVINNTSANPISGTFSNLPDGGTITSANGTVYKANYSGGTGNDLTLTVQ